MNRNALTVALSLVFIAVILGVTGCQRAAPATNREVTPVANANAAKEPVNHAAIETELLKLESDWATATKARDAEALKRIVADDALLTYPDGSTGTKADELNSLESGAITFDSWEVFDPKVTVLDADAAFITGRSLIKNGKYKDPATKSVTNISGEYRFTDVYARRNGKWQAVASQTTKMLNPPAAASPAMKQGSVTSPAASPQAKTAPAN
jgi:ketosteroid isomerase-like protein